MEPLSCKNLKLVLIWLGEGLLILGLAGLWVLLWATPVSGHFNS